MKKILFILLVLNLTSCAYSYKIGISDSISLEQVSTLEANFSFNIREIDGIKFKEKFNFSAIGTNTITLMPGEHTIVFGYCDCNQHRSIYINGNRTMNFVTMPGQSYRLLERNEGGAILFSIDKI